jgi:hypothetical protein
VTFVEPAPEKAAEAGNLPFAGLDERLKDKH